MSFETKQQATEYIRDQILNNIRNLLTDSPLKVAVRDSAKTNSKYISLYYPNRNDNPDAERVPYTVRISDHDQQYLFRRNRPNAYFQIVPILSPVAASYRKQQIALYDYLSLTLQTDLSDSTRQEMQRLRDQVAQSLDKKQKAFRYTFRGDLEGTIDQMRRLIQKLPIFSEAKALIAIRVEQRVKLKMYV